MSCGVQLSFERRGDGAAEAAGRVDHHLDVAVDGTRGVELVLTADAAGGLRVAVGVEVVAVGILMHEHQLCEAAGAERGPELDGHRLALGDQHHDVPRDGGRRDQVQLDGLVAAREVEHERCGRGAQQRRDVAGGRARGVQHVAVRRIRPRAPGRGAVEVDPLRGIREPVERGNERRRGGAAGDGCTADRPAPGPLRRWPSRSRCPRPCRLAATGVERHVAARMYRTRDGRVAVGLEVHERVGRDVSGADRRAPTSWIDMPSCELLVTEPLA